MWAMKFPCKPFIHLWSTILTPVCCCPFWSLLWQWIEESPVHPIDFLLLANIFLLLIFEINRATRQTHAPLVWDHWVHFLTDSWNVVYHQQPLEYRLRWVVTNKWSPWWPGAGSTCSPLKFQSGLVLGFNTAQGLRVGGPVGSWITKGVAYNSIDVSPRGAAEAGGGCENDPTEQTIAGPRRSHFKGIDH